MTKSSTFLDLFEEALSSCTAQAIGVGALTGGASTLGASIIGIPPFISIPLSIAGGVSFGTKQYEQCVKARKFDSLPQELQELGTFSSPSPKMRKPEIEKRP